MSEKILLNRLGELMAEYSRKRGGKRLTQTELAQRTGIAQSTISAYVTNQVTRYDSDTVARLLQFFDADISEFFIFADADEVSGEVTALPAAV